MRYPYVFFDLDGTLLNTTEGVFESHRYAADKLSLPYPNPKQEYRLMGPSLIETAVNFYKLPSGRAQDFVRVFRQHYDSIGIHHAKPYEGILPLLRELRGRGVSTAVCTMKDERQARRCMEMFDFSGLLDHIYGIDDENPTGKYDVLLRLLDTFGDPHRRQVVLVGDSPNDGRAAERAGVDFAAALYGEGFSNGDTLDIPCVFKAGDTVALRRFLLGDEPYQ